MALIKCPECGKEVSDKSAICIGCGYPIRENIEEVKTNDKEVDETTYEKRTYSKVDSEINSKLSITSQNNNSIPSTSNSTSSDTDNIILMWLAIIGAAVCFFGFVLNDHPFLAFITASACIAFGMWRSTKISPEMQRQMGEIERQKKRRTANISCPYCNSHDIVKISIVGRTVSTSVMGLASNKIGKNWHCNNCKSNF